jgi:hypothetical protein
MAVYVISSETLNEIPWNDSNRAFHLESAQGEVSKKWRNKRWLYYAGSHQRCGCGYQKNNLSSDELAAVNANYMALSNVVDEAVRRGVSIEIVAWFNEFAGSPPEITGEIKSTDIQRPDFELVEGQHLKVVAPPIPPPRRWHSKRRGLR